MANQRLTRETRRNVIDWLQMENVRWQGRLEDDDFLARVFDLDSLPSTDHRFTTARSDIRQHRLYNLDWDEDWIYSDPRFDLTGADDEVFLRFLTELLHPLVRPDAAEATKLAEMLSDLIRQDGYELVVRTRIGGRAVWAARRRSLAGATALPPVRAAQRTFDADYIVQQITRMESAVEDDPSLDIGTAKELVETTCREILEARSVATTGKEDLPQLLRMVVTELNLLADRAGRSRDPETVRRILGSLGTIGGGIAELRNVYGTGHGRSPRSPALSSRHARLAVGAASTLAVFLYETHQELAR